MQGAEHEMAGFRGLDRDRNRFKVAQLADEQHVGVFAQRCAQGVLERSRVVVHLALVDQALLVLVHEFNRVFDRDDVIGPVPVDVVDHRAERGRLSRTGRPGHQHESFGQLAQIENVLGQLELLGGQDLRRDDAKDRADALAIHEHVGAEPRQPGDLVGKVGIVTRLELRLVDGGHNLFEERQNHVGRERSGGVVQPAHLAVLADQRRDRRADVQVGRLQLAHPAEHGIDCRLAPQDRRCASGRFFGRGASDEIGGLERGGELVLCVVSSRGQHRDRFIASRMPAKSGDFSRVFDRRDREATLICLVLAHWARLFVIARLVCAGRAARVRMRSRGVPLLLWSEHSSLSRARMTSRHHRRRPQRFPTPTASSTIDEAMTILRSKSWQR
jgi:hypothetical protein